MRYKIGERVWWTWGCKPAEVIDVREDGDETRYRISPDSGPAQWVGAAELQRYV